MRVPQSGLSLDSPAWPLLQAHITYWGITDVDGSPLGNTLVCGNLVNEPSYQGLVVKVLDGPAAGQVRVIATHLAGTDILTVVDPYTDNTGAVVTIVANTRFVILSVGGGGGAPAPPLAPSIGLWMFGIAHPAMIPSTSTINCPNLAGFPDDIFNNEFWMQVIHNASAPGTAPEREWRRITDYVGATGTFTTDAFTANVEANDLVAICHESIMAIEILGFGTLTANSATVPADITRTEGDNYFNGCMFMPTEGICRFQPRRIVDYTGVGGIFTLDPNNPLTAAPGLVDYIIIGDQTEFIPAADATINRTPADVIGNKTDTATADDMSGLATDSLVRELKRVLLRMSSDAFTANIQGAARTELDTILYQLATYISALGAAYSATVNPGGVAKSNIEQTLEDLGDMLAGATGIVTFPTPRALPANGVSLAEVERYIAEVKPEWAARTSATHTTASGNEETILTTAYTVPGLFYFNLTLRNMVAGDDFTIRVYKRVDGTNYDLKSEQQFVGIPTIRIYEIEAIYTDGTEFVRVTIQRNSATNRAFPYSYNFLRQPVA